jgi:hypothetical protein
MACQTCIKALAGAGCLHGRQLLSPRDVEIRPFVRVSGGARVVRLCPAYYSEPDLSCEVETCRVRRRLVMAETEAGSSSGKLVGDAVVRPRTRRLASKGLDEDLHAFPETQH